MFGDTEQDGNCKPFTLSFSYWERSGRVAVIPSAM